MKPAPFRLVRPDSEDALLALLAEHGGDARLLAGGQSLVPMMNFRIVSPPVVIDLNRMTTLNFVREKADRIEIGAMTRHAEVEDSALIEETCPLLTRAVGFVAHRAVRNRGTIGGSLALAYPGAEMPLALMALGAEVELRSIRGARTVPVSQFLRGALDTALEEDEYVRLVRVPALRPTSRASFVEVSRRHGDYALAAAAVIVDRHPAGGVASVQAAVSGGTAGPVTIAGLAAALPGGTPADTQLFEVAREAIAAVDVEGDAHYPEGYRRQLLATVLARSLDEALNKALNEGGPRHVH